MKIVVNHLTRMEHGYICVAGINLDTGKHIRPVLKQGNRGIRLSTNLLLRNGGPFDIASVVNLGVIKYVGGAPEMEDYLFNPQNMLRMKAFTPDAFWGILKKVSFESLIEIFGNTHKKQGKQCAVDFRTGEASLGCLLPLAPPRRLRIDGYNKIRIDLTDDIYDISPSVTDLRLYDKEQRSPRHDIVQQIARRIEHGVRVILSVGLTRAWTKPGDTAPRHWLQVNNLHLEDDSAWKESSQ